MRAPQRPRRRGLAPPMRSAAAHRLRCPRTRSLHCNRFRLYRHQMAALQCDSHALWLTVAERQAVVVQPVDEGEVLNLHDPWAGSPPNPAGLVSGLPPTAYSHSLLPLLLSYSATSHSWCEARGCLTWDTEPPSRGVGSIRTPVWDALEHDGGMADSKPSRRQPKRSARDSAGRPS
eukprot:GGOE01005329.1.p1 GENE.GGOE01005329.1~~GGOE01005329.1.p1  ORF type:complete len:176 (+),score=9.21 GGOE01005329.1:383-910(+)